ncbi:response regulator [Demequina lutea]|uniref:Transcriptional regulatory protein n=1 Tax=Demequina lutea TaxID=431489 RepID=A0A7Y9ZDE8_9MICO|nr:response regulator [Demequina lutea]NYI42203.1 two-component system CitB family response regulator [Demequina lutea]
MTIGPGAASGSGKRAQALIKTLVIDDDFRVAGIHAAHVAKVDGFECVGQAYNAATAREAIARLDPDLLLLDVHLPDEDGLSLLRSLQAAGTQVDCIIITAAQDVATVKSAMTSGAVYYLVKPFSFDRLRTQLEAYRTWRQELASASTANQATVDSLYNSRSVGISPATLTPRLQPTMQKVLNAVRTAGGPVGAAEIADQLGVSRPTAQRYLGALERRGLLILDLTYGGTGRPLNTYTLP